MRTTVIQEQPSMGNNRQLKQTPPKDGIDTVYACGLLVVGGWDSRITEWKKFCETPMGKYILKLESIITKATS